MNETREFRASSLIPRMSSCFSASNYGKGLALLATIFAFFQRAASQPCSNNLTFPYELEKSPDNVGYCLPLELPTTQSGVTTTVLLSLFNSAQTEMARVLRCPNVVLSNFTDCCLIQKFVKLLSLCNKDIVWQLAIEADMKVKPASKKLDCVVGPQSCDDSSHIVTDIILTFFAIGVLCTILYLIHLAVERFSAYHKNAMDRADNRAQYEKIT